MTSNSAQDPAINEILDFWFGLGQIGWFVESAKHDKTITERFGHLVEKARLTDELDSEWLKTPTGSLALILLLDQFTRNVFREGNHPQPGLSWSGDAKGLRIASDSIAKGFDLRIEEDSTVSKANGHWRRTFFYLPLMHAEDLVSQIACVALFENLKHEVEIALLQSKVEGKDVDKEEEDFILEMKEGMSSAYKHRDCIAAVGRFPKRNVPLGREHTEADKAWLEKHPHGF